MNLGVIFLKTAFLIIVTGFVLGAIITGIFLRIKRKPLCSFRSVWLSLAIGFILCCIGLATCHNPLFRTWHRLQNDAVPSTNCITYDPSFFVFFASYKMDRKSFDAWVLSHHWKLTPCEPDNIFTCHDGPHFGLTSCEAIYESPRGPKGNNLRVYYNNGVVYFSYSVF
jgi:hypothetical protein